MKRGTKWRSTWARSDRPTTWACEACGRVNPVRSDSCRRCGSIRDVREPSPSLSMRECMRLVLG